jgi:UDP-N-acetylglucosamine 2-epimerase (non-hydrolysing)
MTKKRLSQSDLSKSVAVIMGTRPGIIKMAPLVKELTRRGIINFIIHTGQHYSENMDSTFFNALELPSPLARVDDTKNRFSHAEQTAEMMVGVERILIETKPRIVLVCGDANTNLAAGLAARKIGIILGHVESGLRSHDWSMPEEHNRIILDHISELLFAPTEEAVRNLVNDNVRGMISLTGNTIVDATLQGVALGEAKVDPLKEFQLERNKYILFTAHREENVDIEKRLRNIISGVNIVSEHVKMNALFLIHPRTRKMLEKYEMHDMLKNSNHIISSEPLGYFETLVLIKNAAMVLTDSGGVQEEACVLQTPCVTLRDNTERPETISAGCNVIAGTEPADILDCSLKMLSVKRQWNIPFGNGNASVKITDIVEKALNDDIVLADISKQNRIEWESNH